ncbi:MAG: aminotransferase class III-fold pyridoxal phosphate-dependent enzyme, partial [Armatimonadetes bacterium]|nr:aminotransferase class III-fold pyridoxal phosphate-dependent enzyme [Akkermansiaceae bacterium]
EGMVRAAGACLERDLRSLENLECVKEVRGRGMMMGVEVDSSERALGAVKGLLRDGVLALPDGPTGNVVAMTPPFAISAEEIAFAVGKLSARLQMERG